MTKLIRAEFPPWKIISSDSHILNSDGLERTNFESQLRLPHVPDMVFDKNGLSVYCPLSCDKSSTNANSLPAFGLEFNALDALKLVDAEHDLLKVAAADAWREARRDCEFINTIVRPFDWTFTTEYAGSLKYNVGSREYVQLTVDEQTSGRGRLSSDSSLSSQTNQSSSLDSTPADDLTGASASATTPIGWTAVPPAPGDTVDMERLKQRVPLSFFTQLTLFEDELADNGCSSLSVRMRCMPSLDCWLILLRFFLRVDLVLFRLYDTRFYFQSGWSHVLREWSARECVYSAIADAVATEQLPASAITDADALAAAPESLLPVRQTRTHKLLFPKLDA